MPLCADLPHPRRLARVGRSWTRSLPRYCGARGVPIWTHGVDLKDANPELAYNVILDVLAGINDNQAVKQHITTSRTLFPHRRITRWCEMTSKGSSSWSRRTPRPRERQDDDSDANVASVMGDTRGSKAASGWKGATHGGFVVGKVTIQTVGVFSQGWSRMEPSLDHKKRLYQLAQVREHWHSMTFGTFEIRRAG